MTKKLVLSDGTRERELHLVGRIVVGRDPACEISHDDSLLSRRHAEFVTAGNMVTVRDLGSRNGVFVNGARTSEHTLEPGDVVQIGPLRARFVVDEAPRTMSPEAMDVDRTVMRKPFPAASVLPLSVPPAVALAFEEIDEDATRLVPAPRSAGTASEVAPVSRRPEAQAEDDEDEDLTRFKAGPEAPALAPVLRQVDPPARIPLAEPPAMRTRTVEPARPGNPLRTFVYGQLMTLALVVGGTAGLGMLMWRRSLGPDAIDGGGSMSIAWLALPILAAAVGTYLVGTAINRRITHALAAGDRARS